MVHSVDVPLVRWKRRRAAVAAALASFFSTVLFGGVSLTWTDNSSNETGFRIERSLADLVFLPLATVGRNVTTHVDETALPSTVYYYRVAAVNASGISAFSNVAVTAAALPGNTAPTLSALADQSIVQGAALAPIGFSVGDAETSASALVVTASSSNPSLLPLTGIALAGTGASRTITLTPAGGQFGSAAVTVSVTDGALVTSRTFSLTVLATNTAPVISQLPAQSINEDTPTLPLAFKVGDAETPAGNLLLSATSSNSALVPPGNIALGGSGADRMVIVSPALNQSGTALITLLVSDGALNTTTTFALSVNPVNDPPTISTVPNQVVTAGTSLPPLGFTIADPETPAANLGVTAASSNPAIIPAANLLLGGTGANRSLTISPVAGQTGAVTVSLTVTDGALTRTSSFQVTVNPGNTAPTISNIADQTIKKGGNTGSLAFTIGDAETSASTLTVRGISSDVKIVPTNGIVFGGTGGNRTVTVTPVANRTGTVTITVVVSDGILTATDSFLVTVQTKGTPVAAASSTREKMAEPADVSAESAPFQLSMLGPVTGGEPLIGGFAVKGENARQVLVRAIGPGLAQFGVDHPVKAPQLQIFDLAGQLVYASGAWGGDASVAEAFARTGRFPLPAESADAAMLVTLMPGAYTVHITDAAAEGGTALLEILDPASGATSDMVAQSGRASISAGHGLTAGLVVTGSAVKRLIVRGIGPGLAQWGVRDALASPVLALFDQTGRELARNAGADPGPVLPRLLSESPNVEAETSGAELPASTSGSTDAALVVTLAPGVYTITLGSAAGSGGSGLIEVVELGGGDSPEPWFKNASE